MDGWVLQSTGPEHPGDTAICSGGWSAGQERVSQLMAPERPLGAGGTQPPLRCAGRFPRQGRRAPGDVPPGEGCGKDSDWWFRDAVLHPPPPKEPAKPRPAITMAELPPLAARCWSRPSFPKTTTSVADAASHDAPRNRDDQMDDQHAANHCRRVAERLFPRCFHQRRHAGPQQVKAVRSQDCEDLRPGISRNTPAIQDGVKE